MANKISRLALNIKRNADVKRIKLVGNLVLNISGKSYDLTWFSKVDGCLDIVREIGVFVSGRRQRSVAVVLIKYLKFVAVQGGTVGAKTSVEYKKEIEAKGKLSGNTKAQYFSAVLSFLRHLISVEVLEPQDLPCNFDFGPVVPKRTFIESAKGDLDLIMHDAGITVDAAMQKFNLGVKEARALVLCSRWMEVLEKIAINAVRKQLADWDLFKDIVSGSDGVRCVGAGEELVQAWECCANKTISGALRTLYDLFGLHLPTVQYWPEGVKDYLLKSDWGLDRVSAVFFPTIKSLEPFLILMLSNKVLMPNVDSVAFYAYVNCVEPRGDGLSQVTFGKYRGTDIIGTISAASVVVEALKGLEVKVLDSLPWMNGGEDILLKKNIPLFLVIFNKNNGRLKVMDPTTPARAVRRFIKAAASREPIMVPLIGGVTGEQFRTTHMLIARLKGESLFKIRSKAGHADVTTTENYLKRIEVKSLVSERMRDFQSYLIGESSHGMRMVGNGYVCSSQVDLDGECLRFDKCFDCEARRIVFETPRIAAEWIAWVKHITNNSERLRAHRPERWSKVWEPMLAMYQVFIDAMSAYVRREAELIVPSIFLPPLD